VRSRAPTHWPARESHDGTEGGEEEGAGNGSETERNEEEGEKEEGDRGMYGSDGGPAAVLAPQIILLYYIFIYSRIQSNLLYFL